MILILFQLPWLSAISTLWEFRNSLLISSLLQLFGIFLKLGASFEILLERSALELLMATEGFEFLTVLRSLLSLVSPLMGQDDFVPSHLGQKIREWESNSTQFSAE